MRKIIPIFLLTFATLVSVEANPPNVIVIISDDQGYADVGFNGSDEILTPNIDRIAHEGLRFTSAYVTHPVCGPSRAGLLTGRDQGRFGFRKNPTLSPFEPTAGLPPAEDNFAEIMNRGGYRTGIIGKWHMGTHVDLRPNVQGFDEFFGFLAGGHTFFPELLTYPDIESSDKPNAWYYTKLLRNETRIEVDDYITDELSDEAVDFVRRNHDGSFFLYLAYHAPHTPMEATEKYLSRFPDIEDKTRRIYAAMISSMDDGIGRVLDELDTHGIAENTMVFFLGDNGGARNNASVNTPLRGYKGQLFEGGIRVPFALRWPAMLPGGEDFDHPITALDILATVTAAANLPIDPAKPLDGVNLLPYLTGKKDQAPHDILFWEVLSRGSKAVRQGNMKVIVPLAGDEPELYNLSLDLGETHNLATQRPELVEELLARHAEWEAGFIPQAFPPLGSWDVSAPR